MSSPHSVRPPVCCWLKMNWISRHWGISGVIYLKATKGKSETSAVSEPDLDFIVQT